LPGDTPGVSFLIRSVLHQSELCPKEEDCPDHIYRCRRCGYSDSRELDGCPACGAPWKEIDVVHGPNCPKLQVEEAMDSPIGALIRRCFRLLSDLKLGFHITLADITEEEHRVIEQIEHQRQEKVDAGDGAPEGLIQALLRRRGR
jgi:hypothetical protein